MIADFLVACRTNNILEGGYIIAPAFSTAERRDSKILSVVEEGVSPAHESGGKSNNPKPPKQIKELRAEINFLKRAIEKSDSRITELIAAQEIAENMRIKLMGSGEDIPDLLSRLSYSGGYRFGGDLREHGMRCFQPLVEKVDFHTVRTEGGLLPPNFIALLFDKDVTQIEITGFSGNMFIVEITKNGIAPQYTNLYQIVNLNHMKDWLDVTIKMLPPLPSDDQDFKDSIEMANGFLKFLNSIFGYENSCLKSSVATNKIFSLEDDD